MTRSLTLTAVVLSLCFTSSAAEAASPQALLIAPPPAPVVLPKFGFQSYNVHGVGEQVTFVNCHGIAARMGLEPGDTILSMNGFALTYYGAWEQALSNAMLNGGRIHIDIRDVRTGMIAHRDVNLGTPGIGPITPKSLGTPGPVVNRSLAPQVGQPVGPITPKSQNFNNLSPRTQVRANAPQLQQLGNMLKKAID